MEEELISDIEEIRARLDEITEEREHLPDDAVSRRDELQEEEHRLEARLTELEDTVSQETSGMAEEEAAGQTDLTRSPKLPDDREEQ